MASLDWGYSLSGFLVGALVGLTGMGGGSLMTPLLMLLFGIHPATAVGTDLLYAAATKTIGTLVHSRLGNVDWRIVGRLALGSVPTTALTLFVLSRFPKQSASMDAFIKMSIAIALIAAAMSLLFRGRLLDMAAARFRTRGAFKRLAMLTTLLGALLGLLVTLSSVGAGALGVAVLVLLYPNLPAARIVGSDIAHAVSLTMLAGFGHWLIGNVNWHIVAMLLIGSLPGIWLGSHVSNRISERVLFPLLAVVLLFIGGQLLLR